MVEHHPVDNMDDAENKAHNAAGKWHTKNNANHVTGGSEWFHVPHEEYDDFHSKFHHAVTGKKPKHLKSLLKAIIQMSASAAAAMY